jgi:hypothetical protein
MRTLTESGKKNLRNYERETLSRFCQEHGYDEDDFAKQAMAVVKRRLDAIVAGIDFENIPNPLLRQKLEARIKAMNEATDFQTMKEVDNRGSLENYKEMITRHFKHIPIKMDYVAKLSKFLELNDAQDDVAATLQLIDSVPLLSSWEMEFNAFVTGASTFDGLPAIFIYEALLASCYVFISLVVPFLFEFAADGAALADPDKIEKIANDSDFVEALTNCLAFILCEKPADAISSASESPGIIAFIIGLLASGSMGMVWFHEIGHLVQGHLLEPQSHQIEFDADNFAFALYARETILRPNTIFAFLGALTVIFMLELLDTIHQAKESPSHPLSRTRMIAALKILSETNDAALGTAYAYIRNLAALVSPTLGKKWGVSINY